MSVLEQFGKKSSIEFPLLSDEGSKVIDAYGLRNASAKGRQAGVPIPTTIVIGSDGKVVAKLPGTVMRRHSTDALLKAIAQ